MTSAFFDAIHADPWARELVDLATLNASASGAVEEALETIRKNARSSPDALRSTSLVVLGPPGAGKTHLFARLRRRLGPRAVFVHIRPLVHAEMTVSFVLGEVVRQLAFLTPQGMSQVSALVGSLLGALTGVGAEFPSAVLSEHSALSESERIVRLTAALEQVLSIWPEVDEVYLERLLQVPFSSTLQARALLAWLSGRDCDALQLQRIGATASLGEPLALGALRTLSAVAALGAPLVLVFDQLENLIDSDGAGPRLRAYAHLASECVDILRGAVLVHLALDSEWERGIEPSFNAPQRSRIVMRREILALPRASEREELLRLFAQRLPEPREAFPWPLRTATLARLRVEPGMTPRMLLVEFRQALERGAAEEAAPSAIEPAGPQEEGVAESSESAPSSRPAAVPALRELDSEWQRQLDEARRLVHTASEAREPVDAARLADGLLATTQFLPGLSASAARQAPAALRLESETGSEWIALVQGSNHRTVGAVLSKLTALSQQGRVVAVRERARELPPTWKDTRQRQSALLATGRARWVDVAPEDCSRVLARAALLQAWRSGEVTVASGAPASEAVVRDWVGASLAVESWPIGTELLPGGAGGEPAAPGGTTAADVEPPINVQPSAAAKPVSGVALPMLRRLRVASLDRLVREALRVDPRSSRSAVVAELEAAGDRVGWFGRSIVCLRLEP